MNPLQRAAFNRKLMYLAAIVVLFTVSMLWRGVIPVPLASSVKPLRWAHEHTIQRQAAEDRLDLSEINPNETDADVLGSAARLMLTGTRGFAVAATWISAIDKQKRNDFHEFEQRVELVTRLQPNFITPWLYQSWNIAYNVSVEMQGSGDMYYYIVRGIQLQAEGERRNKRSPDMRYWIAWYHQNKFGVSDTVEVLRCLFDLSCIPPSERNPDNFEDPATKVFNYEAFRKFCQDHPHFVRRLRGEDTRSQEKNAKEKLRAPRPEDIVAFLRTHYTDLPCRYRKDKVRNVWTDELVDPKDPDYPKVFPVLPPPFNEGPGEPHPTIETPNDTAPVVGYFSAFKVARAWFSYSLLLLPPALKDDQGNPIPGPNPQPGHDGYDPSKYRIPRMPMLVIFRQAAPRAQSYAAELEQKEGWFDAEGWRVEGWFPSEPQGVVVGAGRPWSQIEWENAAKMWQRHGSDYALSLSIERLDALKRDAALNTLMNPSQEQLEDETLRRRFRAAQAIQYYYHNRTTTNFPYFLVSAETEQLPMTVQARKTLWQADQARKIGEPLKAIRLYKDGLEQWKKILIAFPRFHRIPPPDRGERTEEETYEYELAYFRLLIAHDERVRAYANRIAEQIRALLNVVHYDPFRTVPFPPPGAADPLDPFWAAELNREDIKWFVVENVAKADFSSPFVGSVAADGEPWIREGLKDSVRTKQGVQHGSPPPPAGPPGAPPPPKQP